MIANASSSDSPIIDLTRNEGSIVMVARRYASTLGRNCDVTLRFFSSDDKNAAWE